MKTFVNILYHPWKGYHPLYWKGKECYYFTYYNVHNQHFPKEHPEYRILQDMQENISSYHVENQFFYNNLPIEKEAFIDQIPFKKFICKPIRYGEEFVYRIHLLITPPTSFFDGFRYGYFIRNIHRPFVPRYYYDPFTFSILRDNIFTYVEKNESIAEKVDFATYPYVARDFLIQRENIEAFIQYMEQKGWRGEQIILTHKDLYDQLKEINERIKRLQLSHQSEELKERFIYQLFSQRALKPLQTLMGNLHIDIEDICNSYMVLWDEALELKNIFRKYEFLEIPEAIQSMDMNELYRQINQKALDEISQKHQLLKELSSILQWKINYIHQFSQYDPLKEWVLTAGQPYYIFSNQLEIWNEFNTSFQDVNYTKYLTFADEKYRLSFDSKIVIYPRKDNSNRTVQEELKILMEEYIRRPDYYTKRRIQQEIQNLKTTLKILKEIMSLLP